MIKEYFVLFLVLIALDYSQTEVTENQVRDSSQSEDEDWNTQITVLTEDKVCPHYTFDSWHRCKKYDMSTGRERECTDDEISEFIKDAEKKFAPLGRNQHSIFFYPFAEEKNFSRDKIQMTCTARNTLPKHLCTRPIRGQPWTCVRVNAARPIHSTVNGHYIGDA